MTARARITAAELREAAKIAKEGGVAVTIAAGGKTVTIAPVDGTTESAHAPRTGGNSCDEAFGT